LNSRKYAPLQLPETTASRLLGYSSPFKVAELRQSSVCRWPHDVDPHTAQELMPRKSGISQTGLSIYSIDGKITENRTAGKEKNKKTQGPSVTMTASLPGSGSVYGSTSHISCRVFSTGGGSGVCRWSHPAPRQQDPANGWPEVSPPLPAEPGCCRPLP